MDLIGTGSKRRKRVGYSEAAVVVAMPIDSDFLAGWFYDLVDHKFHKIASPARRGVADGVAKHDGVGARSGWPWSTARPLWRVGANGVLGDVHDRETGGDRIAYGVLGDALEMIVGPILD